MHKGLFSGELLGGGAEVYVEAGGLVHDEEGDDERRANREVEIARGSSDIGEQRCRKEEPPQCGCQALDQGEGDVVSHVDLGREGRSQAEGHEQGVGRYQELPGNLAKFLKLIHDY